MRADLDTIAAVATPAGRGAIGVVRVSGPLVRTIASRITGSTLTPRRVSHRVFVDEGGQPLDQGLAFFLEGPHSFTGEDVLELQGHGSPIVMGLLLDRVCALGARLARPGEFSERAFLNGKIDLTQAEAVADLIGSLTTRAAQGALHALQGEFSLRVRQVLEALIGLRARIEGCLDFSEEDVASFDSGALEDTLSGILTGIERLMADAHRGQVLRDGARVAIAGRPNVGKSSLLNRLARRECAIVTEYPGTTRDAIHVQLDIDGLAVELFDTAGVRDTEDPIEQEGIRRTEAVVQGADHVLWVSDAADPTQDPGTAAMALGDVCRVTEVHNKIDLVGMAPCLEHGPTHPHVYLSAKTGAGLPLLERHLREAAGLSDVGTGGFSARRRHVGALARARDALRDAWDATAAGAGEEIIAEHLRMAQRELSEITGEFTSEELLGEIFSTFCIGK